MTWMWRITGFAIFFLLSFPTPIQAESVEFLDANITDVKRSLVCPARDVCQSLFLISGRNFLNSNGKPGVRVGDEWARVIRLTNSLIVAVASEAVLENTPIVTVDEELRRPTFVSEDETLTEMFEESINAAIASIHVTEGGRRYVIAGPKYDLPTRVYYRDTYWSSGLILMIEPYVIRDQILLLASGIENNGSTPSAIPVDPDEARLSLWVDHVDSAPYFVMLVYDYIAWTGDTSILTERIDSRSVYTAMEDALSWLSSKDQNGNYLPEKSADSLQDWLDSIPRGGEVFSNEVLYYQALRNMVDLSQLIEEPTHALMYHRRSLLVRYQINKQFWDEEDGFYYERCEDQVCEERVTGESALAILYDIANADQRTRLFERLRMLESANNPDIAYGDWGTLNAWPLYEDLTPYDYHNGTDWPFLDGINAGARLKYSNDDWYYPLTRWWTYNQEQDSGRVLPEYVSPVDLDGGDQQAWSVNPIVSFIRYGLGLNPDLYGYYTTRHSPDGPVRLEGVVLRGQRISIEAQE